MASVPYDLHPSYLGKKLHAMKADRAIKRYTFNPSKAEPGDILTVRVPKLKGNEVIVPNSLAIIFDIDLSGGHANNFLVQNISRALVEKLVVKFGTNAIDNIAGHDIYKIFQDLFLPEEKRDNMVPEGIQSEDLCKIRSKSGDKKTTGVDAENKLNKVDGSQYRINLDHQILTGHGVFYPSTLYHHLEFELTLAPASQVVRGSDPTKLNYKLNNIQIEYEMIESKSLADDAVSIYTSGKEFIYDHVVRKEVVPIDKAKDVFITINVNAQRRSMKAILLLFVEPYVAGTRDSEKYIFPDLKKIDVTIKGSPSMLYNTGIEPRDMWREVSRFFIKEEQKRPHMNRKKFYTENKFGLLIDLRSVKSQEMHGSGTRIVNSNDGVQLEIERDAIGSGKVNCYVYVISDAQFNIIDKQLESVQF